jgi:hypothetical protein
MKFKRNDPENPNVIFCQCCFDMGKRFHKMARVYELRGDTSTGQKLRIEAAQQFSALRRARKELREIAC